MDPSLFLSGALAATFECGQDRPFCSPIRGAVVLFRISGILNAAPPPTSHLAGSEDWRTSLAEQNTALSISNLFSIYEDLVSIVNGCGGDVISIIGGSLLALFSDGPEQGDNYGPLGPPQPLHSRRYSHLFSDPTNFTLTSEDEASLAGHCYHAVESCVRALEKLNGAANGLLEIRAGVACGQVQALHAGGWQERSQLLLIGEPLKQLAALARAAEPGTVLASSRVRSLITPLARDREFAFAEHSAGVWHVTKRADAIKTSSSPSCVPYSPPPTDERTTLLLTAYLCDEVIARCSKASPQTDMLPSPRMLSVVMVRLPVCCEAQWTRHHVQQCFIAIQKAVTAHRGTFLHSLSDDQGVTAVLTFESTPHDAYGAVVCALALQSELMRRGARAIMSIATGLTWCGIVGSSTRKEFTIFGGSFDTATSLLSFSPLDGPCAILCDDATRDAAIVEHSTAATDLQSPKQTCQFDPCLEHDRLGQAWVVSLVGPPVTEQGLMEHDHRDQQQEDLESWGGDEDSIMEDGEGTAKRHMAGPPGELPRAQEGPMVGREREMAVLNDVAEAWANGFSAVVLITGEAGMGKTTLTESAISSLSCLPQASSGSRSAGPCHANGRAVFRVKFDPFVTSDFRVWADVLVQAVDFLMREEEEEGLPKHKSFYRRRSHMIQSRLRSLFSQRSPTLIPYLAVLNPILRTHFLETTDSSELSAKSRFACLFECCSEIISAVSVIAPVCICAEDAHAWDPTCWKFATQLARSCFIQGKAEREAALFHRVVSLQERNDPRATEQKLELMGEEAGVGLMPRDTESTVAHRAPAPPLVGGRHPLLLVFSSRMQNREIQDENGQSVCVRLGPLSEDGVRDMIQGLLPGALSVGPEVASLIHFRSQGNPLYVRELTLSLFYQKLMIVDCDGLCSFSLLFSLHPLRSTENVIQMSIHDVIRSRIGSLSAEHQLFIKVASVIGIQFDVEVVVAIHPMDLDRARAEKMASDLYTIGLLSCIHNEQGAYCFYHHLIQEVCYSLLVSAQKRLLHKNVAALLANDDQLPAELEGMTASGILRHRLSDAVHEENADRGVLPALAHHWVLGGVPDRARPCLARLAEEAHECHLNKEAVRWFTLLFEEEEECPKKSSKCVLARWYRKLGDCYLALEDHISANDWLLASLRQTSFEPPAKKLTTKTRLLKEAAAQYLRRRAGIRPRPVADEETALEQIRALKSLSFVRFLLHDTLGCTYYLLCGANLCESMKTLPSEASVIFSMIAHTLGGLAPQVWADRYLELSNLCAARSSDRVAVLQSTVSPFVWSCDPRAPKAIGEGLALMQSTRSWTEVGVLHIVGAEYCFHHGLLDEHADHVGALETETRARENVIVELYSYVQSACLALMSDDRATASSHVKKAIASMHNFRESGGVIDKPITSALPVLAAHLVFRDHRWPQATSPHLSAAHCAWLVHFATHTQKVSTEPPEEHNAHLAALSSFREFSFDDMPGPDPGSDSWQDRADSDPIASVQQLVEAGLSSIPDAPLGLSYFHSFHLGLELALLHGVPCNDKVVKSACSAFEKSSVQLTLFRPMALLWSAWRKLRKRAQDSSAISQLREAEKLAMHHGLPLQEAFSHFLLSLKLSEFTSGGFKLPTAKIQKLTRCEPPHDAAKRALLDHARTLLLQSGHTFYPTMFSYILSSENRS